MLKTTDIAHLLIKEHIKDTDLVVDATCGNGYDTLFLASLVKNGKVLSYDIQEEALNNAKLLTKDFNNIEFFQTSHEFINVQNCSCVLFNLGYLPKGNKKITTNHLTTMNAVKNLVNSFSNNLNLVIYIIVYPGHEEGSIESIHLLEYTKGLDSKKYLVTLFKPHNQINAPYLLTISLKH